MASCDLNYYAEMEEAQNGDLDAMFNVASYIIWGDQTSPVEPEAAELAIRYYAANADAGDTDSMLDLGGMYLVGRGVEKDESKALMWYRKAAERNGPNACGCLGNLYRYDVLDDGTTVPTADPARLQKALEWYRLGAERDEENSLYELGDFYRKGMLVERDEAKAFSLYQRAYGICQNLRKDHFSLNDSYADVCLRLAECYHHGIGTRVDLEKARRFVQIAKDEAQVRLDSGDAYGGCLYPRVRKEWLAILSETGF